jgi:uncharacterized protein (UPF0248 family)
VTHPVRNLLNRLRWDKNENPENYEITYRHRGAPGNVKRTRASLVHKLGKSYFTIQENSEEESIIPFHRILEIRNTLDGSVLWVKREPSRKQ